MSEKGPRRGSGTLAKKFPRRAFANASLSMLFVERLLNVVRQSAGNGTKWVWPRTPAPYRIPIVTPNRSKRAPSATTARPQSPTPRRIEKPRALVDGAPADFARGILGLSRDNAHPLGRDVHPRKGSIAEGDEGFGESTPGRLLPQGCSREGAAAASE